MLLILFFIISNILSYDNISITVCSVVILICIFCSGSAANVTGKVFPLNYNPINPPLSYSTVKRLQPDISKKITDLSHSLNR